jgi:hypothetical protein
MENLDQDSLAACLEWALFHRLDDSIASKCSAFRVTTLSYLIGVLAIAPFVRKKKQYNILYQRWRIYLLEIYAREFSYLRKDIFPKVEEGLMFLVSFSFLFWHFLYV